MSHLTSAVSGALQLTPIGFLPLRCFNWLSPLFPGLPHPICSTYRLFQPLSGLLLCQPGGPVSCLLHPWGSAQKRFPLTSIHAPLGVDPLMSLDECLTYHLHGAVDGLSCTRRYPSHPISTSGGSPDVSPFTCLWYYPLHRADPLESFAL